MSSTRATEFLLTDQVGSLRVVADTSGNIVKRVDYDSFGSIIADSNPGFSVPFGFAGGLHDLDTGLVRFGFRDYSPELGQFTAKDPIDFAGGDTNLYAYVSNDPINWIDPLGLCLSPEQKMIVGVCSSVASGLASLTPFWWASGVAGGLAGGAAALLMDGSTGADVLNSALSGAASGFLGGGLERLMEGTAITSLKSAITTGAITGMFDAIGLAVDPLIPDPTCDCP